MTVSARRWGGMVLAACLAIGLPPGDVPVRWAEAAEPQAEADLQETLEAGLKARRPAEFAFIHRVVQLVDEGKLTRSLVTGVFEWARRQPKGGHTPFPWFERAMRLQAAKIGVTI